MERVKWYNAPSVIWNPDNGLSVYEKSLLAVLAMHRNGKTKQCNPSYQLILREANMSKRMFYKCRKKLIDDGWIAVTPRTNRATWYELLFVEDPEPGGAYPGNSPGGPTARTVVHEGTTQDKNALPDERLRAEDIISHPEFKKALREAVRDALTDLSPGKKVAAPDQGKVETHAPQEPTYSEPGDNRTMNKRTQEVGVTTTPPCTSSTSPTEGPLWREGKPTPIFVFSVWDHYYHNLLGVRYHRTQYETEYDRALKLLEHCEDPIDLALQIYYHISNVKESRERVGNSGGYGKSQPSKKDRFRAERGHIFPVAYHDIGKEPVREEDRPRMIQAMLDFGWSEGASDGSASVDA